jgi:hypothetical protein
MGLIQLDQRGRVCSIQGLRNAFVFSDGIAYDAVARRKVQLATAFGQPVFANIPGGGGKGLYTPNGSAARIDLNEDWSGPSTTIWRGLLNGITSPWGAYWAKAGTGNAVQISIGRFDTSDNFCLGRQGTVQQLTSSSISSSSVGVATFALVVESQSTSGSVVLYRNGALVQGVSSAYFQTTGVGSLYLGCESTVASSTYAADAYWSSFFRFDRVLSAAEIAAIGNNPSKLLLAPKRIWVPVSAPVESTGGLVSYKRKWTSQPQGPAPLDAELAAAYRLDTLFSFNGQQGLRNLVQTDKVATNLLTGGFTTTPVGVGITSIGAGSLNLGQIGNYTSGSFFLALRVEKIGVISGSPVLIYKGPYAGTGYFVQITTAGALVFNVGTDQTNKTPTGTFAEGGSYTIVINHTNGSTPQIFVNGVDVTITGSNLTISSSAADLSVMAYRGGGTSNQLSGTLVWYAQGQRRLSEPQARALHVNPWQLFSPRRIWVPVTAAGSSLPTLSSLIASLLTSTGGRLTVTAT